MLRDAAFFTLAIFEEPLHPEDQARISPQIRGTLDDVVGTWLCESLTDRTSFCIYPPDFQWRVLVAGNPTTMFRFVVRANQQVHGNRKAMRGRRRFGENCINKQAAHPYGGEPGEQFISA